MYDVHCTFEHFTLYSVHYMIFNLLTIIYNYVYIVYATYILVYTTYVVLSYDCVVLCILHMIMVKLYSYFLLCFEHGFNRIPLYKVSYRTIQQQYSLVLWAFSRMATSETNTIYEEN